MYVRMSIRNSLYANNPAKMLTNQAAHSNIKSQLGPTIAPALKMKNKSIAATDQRTPNKGTMGGALRTATRTPKNRGSFP